MSPAYGWSFGSGFASTSGYLREAIKETPGSEP